MSQKNKVYGLILPKKQGQVKPQPSKTFNVFHDNSDEDEEPASGPVAPYKVTTGSSKMKRQTQMDIDKALQEDPSIYEYDKVYDELQANKPQVGFIEKDKTKTDRKPKYIAGLLKAAGVKKKEEERRIERKVQKEREAEGEMYADKEKFVTSAYKQKMLEMQEAEEKERQEAAFEAMTDVTKQKDMSGFYRYLYRQTGRSSDAAETPGQGKGASGQSVEVKEEPPSPHGSPRQEKPERRRSRSASSQESSRSHTASDPKEKTSSRRTDTHRRQKRHDSTSSSSSENEQQSKKSEHSTRRARSNSNSSENSDMEGSHPRDTGEQRRRNLVAPRGSHSPEASSKGKSGKHKGSRSPHRERRGRKRSLSPQERNRKRSRSPRGSQEREKSGSRKDRYDRKKERSLTPSEKRDRKTERSVHPRERHERRRERSESQSRERNMSRSPQKEKGGKRKRSVTPEGRDDGPQDHVNGADVSVSKNLKSLRESSTNSASEDKSLCNSKPVDPSKKVYPHHNSAKDIEEARKRYFQRKLARERGRLG